MCEICQKHGDGDKWYLNPKNYSRELGEARLEFLEKIAGPSYDEWLINKLETIERLRDIPLINKLSLKVVEKYEIKMYGGQIIPLNDVLKVLEFCENPALISCACRQFVGQEKYCCLNFGLLPELYKKANSGIYMEELSVNKAKRLMTNWNKKGFYHLILWSKLPYVTTICNCTTPSCTAYKSRYLQQTKNALIKGEYVASVNETRCDGCKNCLTRCPFGAISFNVDGEKAFVDVRRCFGCGLCEIECKPTAIELIERKLTPAKDIW